MKTRNLKLFAAILVFSVATASSTVAANIIVPNVDTNITSIDLIDYDVEIVKAIEIDDVDPINIVTAVPGVNLIDPEIVLGNIEGNNALIPIVQ